MKPLIENPYIMDVTTVLEQQADKLEQIENKLNKLHKKYEKDLELNQTFYDLRNKVNEVKNNIKKS